MSRRIYTILKKAFGSTEIPTGADLNNYKTVGKYYMSYAINQYTNTPTGHGFEGWAAYMRVFKQFAPTQEKWIEQRLTIGGKFLTFARRWSGTEWSPWQIVSGSIDALVEKGTSGYWNYEKWASGKVEAWTTGKKAATGASAGTSTLGYDWSVTLTIPAIFKNVEVVSGHIANNPDTVARWGAFTGWNWNSSNPTTLILYSSGNYSISKIGLSINIKGTWK